MDLPVYYKKLTRQEKRLVREEYKKRQNNKCFYCGGDLDSDPPPFIMKRKINWYYFPKDFLKYPIHLQHDHKTGMTEGAVHAYCNAVMWQYEEVRTG